MSIKNRFLDWMEKIIQNCVRVTKKYYVYDTDAFTHNLEVLYLDNYNIDAWGELKYKYESDSGFDIRAAIKHEKYLHSGSPKLIETGVKFNIPKGYEVVIRPRSGLGSKGIMCCFGTIDEGYVGEVKVTLYIFGLNSYLIEPGERIAQCVLQKKSKCKLLRVNSFSNETDRGEKGFGSTGIK